jgi:hypothetical protein
MSHSFQECTECGKEKPYKDFYRIYGGYRIKKCKICYCEMRKAERKEKERRKKAAKLW